MAVRRRQAGEPLPGFPVHAPLRTAAEVDTYLAEDRLVCLLCGHTFRSVGHHIARAHGVSVEEYQDRYGIPRGRGLVGAETRKAFATSVRATHAAGTLRPHVEALAAAAGQHGGASATTKRAILAAGIRDPWRSMRLPAHKVAKVLLLAEAGLTLSTAVRRVGISWSGFHAAAAREAALAERLARLPIRKGRRKRMDHDLED